MRVQISIGNSRGQGTKRHALCAIPINITLCLSFLLRENTGLGSFRLNHSAAYAHYNAPGDLRARHLNQRRLAIIFRKAALCILRISLIVTRRMITPIRRAILSDRRAVDSTPRKSTAPMTDEPSSRSGVAPLRWIGSIDAAMPGRKSGPKQAQPIQDMQPTPEDKTPSCSVRSQFTFSRWGGLSTALKLRHLEYLTAMAR